MSSISPEIRNSKLACLGAEIWKGFGGREERCPVQQARCQVAGFAICAHVPKSGYFKPEPEAPDVGKGHKVARRYLENSRPVDL